MKVIKTCYGDDVEFLTSTGWVLIATHVMAERFVEHRHIVKEAGYREGMSNYQPAEYKTEAAVLADPMFVLEKDSEVISRESELIAQVNQAMETERNQAKMIHDLQQKVFQAEQNQAVAERSLESWKADYRVARERIVKLEKLEGDLAKIRKEIGEARWREVIGE